MATKSVAKRVRDELGITSLMQSGRDVHLILVTKTIRMFAYGSSTLILALFLSTLGEPDTRIGLFMTLTLVGDVGISLLLSLVADALGRRRILLLGSLSMTLAGAVFALATPYWVLLLAAVVGVISPSGNEIGPFRTVEESTLAHLSDMTTRADLFALYVVVGALGASAGSFVCGWVTHALQTRAGWSVLGSYRFIFALYAVIGLVKAMLTLCLSRKCEIAPPPEPFPTREEVPRQEGVAPEGERQPLLNGDANSRVPAVAAAEGEATAAETPPPAADKKEKKSAWAQISKESRWTLAKICGIMTFDSLASGMVPFSLIAYYIDRKFTGISSGTLGTIIAIAQFCSSLGNIFASSLARRIGLVKTMVFTHLPSAVLLALIPAPTSLILTIIILTARSSIASMDQAPRSAFLSAVVLPHERTAVMGIVNTVKTSAQSMGPLITGGLASGHRFWIAFVVAGALKAAYDISMLVAFVNAPLEGDKKPTSGEVTEPDDNDAQQPHEDDIGASEQTSEDHRGGQTS